MDAIFWARYHGDMFESVPLPSAPDPRTASERHACAWATSANWGFGHGGGIKWFECREIQVWKILELYTKQLTFRHLSELLRKRRTKWAVSGPKSAILMVSLGGHARERLVGFAGCFKKILVNNLFSRQSILILGRIPLANFQAKPTNGKTRAWRSVCRRRLAIIDVQCRLHVGWKYEWKGSRLGRFCEPLYLAFLAAF